MGDLRQSSKSAKLEPWMVEGCWWFLDVLTCLSIAIMDGNHNKTLSRPCFKVIYVNSTMILTYSYSIHCIFFWWFCAWAGIGKTGRIWDGTYLSNGWDHNGYQAVDAAQICVQMQLRWWHGLCLWLGSSLQTTSRAHGMASPTWSWPKRALKLRTDMEKKH